MDSLDMLTRPPTLAEHRFLHELARLIDAGANPTADDVGHAADQDAREAVEALAGLVGLRLVMEAVGANGPWPASPYTLKPLELTALGARFLDNAPAPFD